MAWKGNHKEVGSTPRPRSRLISSWSFLMLVIKSGNSRKIITLHTACILTKNNILYSEWLGLHDNESGHHKYQMKRSIRRVITAGCYREAFYVWEPCRTGLSMYFNTETWEVQVLSSFCYCWRWKQVAKREESTDEIA